MKFLRLLLFVLTAGIVFTSCQKELSAETGSALGTLTKDAGGNCTGSLPSGAYKKDTSLNATNFVDVQVDITNVGIYIISTDTVNGYYFRATGVTPVPGANTIRLIGFGKPLAAGTNLFKVKFNGDVCEFAVTVTGTIGGGTTAVFTFPNAAACTGASQTNNFFVGIPTNAAINTMTIPVIVAQAGTYTLNTTLAGGLTFSGSGTLAIGNQQIVLGASGTPAGPLAGTINYTFSTTTPVASSCGFSLNVQAAPTPATYTINCATAATQTGTFVAGTALSAASKVTLSVTPTSIGAYSITTNTVNGVSYIGAGVFTTTVTQNVDLFVNPANNTPTAAGSFNYASVGGTTICSNVSVTYTGAPTPATYSFNCGSATFAGIYQIGTAMTASNTIAVPVTVTTPGSYTITTSNVNGVSFIGSGNLTATSTSITLTATGLPTAGAAPSTTFVLSGGGGANCSVTIPFTPATPPTSGVIQCQVDGILRTFNISAKAVYDNTTLFGLTALVVSGDNNTTDNEAIFFALGNTGGGGGSPIIPGVYNTNQLATCLISASYDSPTGASFGTISGVPVPTPFTIEIISISATNVQGKFYGPLGTKSITLGTFNVPIL